MFFSFLNQLVCGINSNKKCYKFSLVIVKDYIIKRSDHLFFYYKIKQEN
jgi:hypothetical protein